MIEINLSNAFRLIVKFTWDYGFLKFTSVCDATNNTFYKAICYLLMKPNTATCLFSFIIIFVTTLWVFSMTILLGVLCSALILIILEGLAVIIIVIMACQGLTIFVLSFLCMKELLSCYKPN